MSLVTINDVGVLSGTIESPLVGVWTADLVIDQPDGSGFDAGTQVTIKAADGVQLVGVVAADRAGDFLDTVHVRVLGGAGGMGSLVSKRAYNTPSAFVRDVLNGIVQDVGETLSSNIATGLLATDLSAWNTFAVPASQALVSLLAIVAPNADWRIQADGKLWMGDETWPTAAVEYDLTNHDPAQATYELGITSPSFMAGVAIDGVGKVARVQHVIDADHIRARVWTDLDSERGIRAAVSRMVRQELSGIDYFTLYDAKVVSQSADGATVDVQPGDPRLPGMSKVPLRLGLPGCVAKFSPGQYVRIGWDRGSPQLPYACLFQGGESVTNIQLAGTHPLPLWDDFLTDLIQALGYVATSNGGGPIINNIPGWTQFITKLGTTLYKSEKVSNG